MCGLGVQPARQSAFSLCGVVLPSSWQVGTIFPVLSPPPTLMAKPESDWSGEFHSSNLLTHCNPTSRNSVPHEALLATGKRQPAAGGSRLFCSCLFAELPQAQFWWQTSLVHRLSFPTCFWTPSMDSFRK